MEALAKLDRLRQCEAIVEKTKKNAWDFVRALKEIKDDGLWHEAQAPAGEASYINFDDYAQRRFGFTRNYANRLIKGLAIQDSVPIGTDLNEAQARELGKIPSEDRAKVLSRAEEKAASHGGEVTAKIIREAVADFAEAEPLDMEEPSDGDYCLEAKVAAETDARDGRYSSPAEQRWAEIIIEAEEIARDIGNHARMAEFIESIAARIGDGGPVVIARLDNLAVTLRHELDG
jgi:hypothetical protein